MKLKRVCALGLTIVLYCCLVGCSLFPDGTLNNKNVEIDVTIGEDGIINGKLNDKFNVNATISYPEGIKSIDGFKANVRKMNKVKADATVEKLSKYLGKVVKDCIESGGNPGLRYFYTFDDGSQYYDGDYIQYKSSDYSSKNYSACTSSKKYGRLIADDVLEDFSLSDAKAKAKEAIKLFDEFDFTEEPVDCYALSVKNVNEYRESQGMQFTDWSKEDEAYVFTFLRLYNDIPICADSIDNGSYFSNSHNVNVIVGREEIELIEIDALYDVLETKEITDTLCSVEEALEILATTYKYTSQLNTHEIVEINLVYVPLASVSAQLKEYDANPYWEFVIETEKTANDKKGTYTYKKKSYYLVNAVTKATFLSN
ncbi:MAG: hypothetical protein ACI4DS_07870 [Eubacterium sp.]